MKNGFLAVLLLLLVSGVVSADHFLGIPKKARKEERNLRVATVNTARQDASVRKNVHLPLIPLVFAGIDALPT